MVDVIVVGARVTGASTAMLLARSGLSVLVVDRTTFPSDTLSTHQVQLPGVARLKRWGLLDRLIAAGTPPAHRVRFDSGGVVLTGAYPEADGVDAVYSPRRRLLDALIVDAARASGAEVREGFTVDELIVDDGRVRGVRGRARGGRLIEERATLVVGADGKHSLVARTVGAGAYRERPVLSVGYYTYWDGLPIDGGEIYGRDRCSVGAWPTNDGLVMTFVARPVDEFDAFRADTEGMVMAALDQAGDLGDRARAGRRADRFYGSADLPNRFRTPFGPGWALAGDAGLVVDPITGQGIGHGLRDAELIAQAIVDGLGGRRPLDGALADYQARRDRETIPMYDFTTEIASFEPASVAQKTLFRAIAGKPAETNRFFGVMTGSEPVDAYLSPRNLLRIVGLRGMLRIGRQRGRPGAMSSAA